MRDRGDVVFTQMIRRAASGTVAAAAVLTMTVGAGTPASAAGEFGEHVSTCTRTGGFGADHNPGMHQGFHGWDPAHTC